MEVTKAAKFNLDRRSILHSTDIIEREIANIAAIYARQGKQEKEQLCHHLELRTIKANVNAIANRTLNLKERK